MRDRVVAGCLNKQLAKFSAYFAMVPVVPVWYWRQPSSPENMHTVVLAVGSPRIKLYLIPASSAAHSYCVTLTSQWPG